MVIIISSSQVNWIVLSSLISNAPQVEEPIKKKEKSRCCYLCRGKGHFASSCTVGNIPSPIILDDVYSLRKDRSGNVFANYRGAQSGGKKSTIWVHKPIVTNLLGPNLVGDQQASTWSIGVGGGHWRLGFFWRLEGSSWFLFHQAKSIILLPYLISNASSLR